MLVQQQRAGVRGPAGDDAAQIPEMFVRVMSPLLPGPGGVADRWASRWARSLSSWEALARLIRVLDLFYRMEARDAGRVRMDEWLRLHAGWCCCLAEAFRLHLAAEGAELPEVPFGGPAASPEDTAVAGTLLELWNHSTPSPQPLAPAFAEPIAQVLHRLYDWTICPNPMDARC
jgi:hypothetical protein